MTQILLQVDSELMSNYQGLQASLEEAQDEAEKANEGDASATADAQATADASAEPTATPVTQAGRGRCLRGHPGLRAAHCGRDQGQAGHRYALCRPDRGIQHRPRHDPGALQVPGVQREHGQHLL